MVAASQGERKGHSSEGSLGEVLVTKLGQIFRS